MYKEEHSAGFLLSMNNRDAIEDRVCGYHSSNRNVNTCMHAKCMIYLWLFQYIMHMSVFQCFLSPDNDDLLVSNTSTLLYNGHIIKKGDVVKCFTESDYQTANRGSSDNWLMLNAIFWPTLLFISGFVGLFLVVIYLLKIKDAKYKKRMTKLRRLGK